MRQTPHKTVGPAVEETVRSFPALAQSPPTRQGGLRGGEENKA